MTFIYITILALALIGLISLVHHIIYPLVDAALYACGGLLFHYLSVEWPRWFHTYWPWQIVPQSIRCWWMYFLQDLSPYTTETRIGTLHWVPYFCYYRSPVWDDNWNMHRVRDQESNLTRYLRRASAIAQFKEDK